MLQKPNEQRVVLAFFAQPLVVALLAFAIFPVIEYTSRSLSGMRSVDMLDSAIAVAAGAGLAAVFVVAFGAVPLYAWFTRQGPITRNKVLLSGILLGNLPGVLVVMMQALAGGSRGSAPGAAEALRAVLIPSFVGAVAALVFWHMAGLARCEEPQKRREPVPKLD